MTILNDLGFVPVAFEDIRQGDIIGYVVGDLFVSGVADHIDESIVASHSWETSSGFSLTPDLTPGGDDTYRYSKPVDELAVNDSVTPARRGRFPEDGTLVLTETVGDWEEGLIFYTGIANWFLYDPIRDETTEKVDTHLLRELFEQGKLVVTERF